MSPGPERIREPLQMLACPCCLLSWPGFLPSIRTPPQAKSPKQLPQDARESMARRDERSRTGRSLPHIGTAIERTHVNWNYVWVSLAAGVLLTVALGIYSYEAGKRRAPEVVQVAPAVD